MLHVKLYAFNVYAVRFALVKLEISTQGTLDKNHFTNAYRDPVSHRVSPD